MTKTVKILHIITDTNIGGAGHQLIALLDAMEPGFDLAVILPENARLEPILRDKGIECHPVPHIADQSYSRAGVRVLKRKIREIKPHIVHAHGCLSGRIAAKRYGKCKIVHTAHCAYPVASWRKGFPFKLISGFINNYYSHQVIATSPVAQDVLLDMGTKKSKIRIILNGMPPAKDYTPEEKAKIREKYNIPPDTFVVAHIARLTEIKGHDYVLDTAKELPFNVLVLFAGDGDREAHLRARIQKEKLSNVRLLGFVQDVDEILAIMDVQVNASFVSETTSLALLFGMSVGKPAIVTNHTGNPYVIKEGVNGLLVPPQDPQALDDAITRMKDDPDLYQQLCQGALQTYQREFTATRMAKETAAVYMNLLEGTQ